MAITAPYGPAMYPVINFPDIFFYIGAKYVIQGIYRNSVLKLNCFKVKMNLSLFRIRN